MKFVITSAADQHYFTPLKSLILSLEVNANKQFDIGVLNLGLEHQQVTWLQDHSVTVIKPGWDIKFPNRGGLLGDKFKAMVSRPFIQKYFPGFDYYIWIDADAWLQDGTALDLLIEGARRSGVAVTPEIDRSYEAFYNNGFTRNWMGNLYLEGWGIEIAKKLVDFPIVNSGGWCIKADHPLWKSWQVALTDALQKTQNFYIEQTAFNYSIYTRSGWDPHLLPATTNWNCAHATPHFHSEKRCFVEPYLPHSKIGIMHLCGISPKDKKVSVRLTNGEMQNMCMLFLEGDV